MNTFVRKVTIINKRIYKNRKLQIFNVKSKDSLRYKIKNTIKYGQYISIETGDIVHNMNTYTSYPDYKYSEDTIDNHITHILDDIESCIYDNPDKSVYLISYIFNGLIANVHLLYRP